ncbi:hypothetical protein P7K49_006106 [Saguinus oedipus]|uniref:Uncharacterized protein n=1 Tax=Saguinus oedipus TaxID=9490 RepID=A0ABQ9W1Z1_SAGOE|nr:hypothetical protein P7K49_006106 [Saguinus oedipus]
MAGTKPYMAVPNQRLLLPQKTNHWDEESAISAELSAAACHLAGKGYFPGLWIVQQSGVNSVGDTARAVGLWSGIMWMDMWRENLPALRCSTARGVDEIPQGGCRKARD